MSCDWDVKCLDCNEKMGFDDANHAVDLMQKIISHAKELAALVPFVRATDSWVGNYYGSVRIEWLAIHCNHRLVAINEYGEIDSGDDKA